MVVSAKILTRLLPIHQRYECLVSVEEIKGVILSSPVFVRFSFNQLSGSFFIQYEDTTAASGVIYKDTVRLHPTRLFRSGRNAQAFA